MVNSFMYQIADMMSSIANSNAAPILCAAVVVLCIGSIPIYLLANIFIDRIKEAAVRKAKRAEIMKRVRKEV